MSTSKLQRQVSQELSYHFGGYIIRENIRPEWLDYLELDFLIEELNIAIEVQGEQHYRYSSLFHDNSNGFKEQVERDEKKRVICDNRGIRLFEIASDSEIKQVINNILLMLPKSESNKIFVENLKEQNNNTPLSHRRKTPDEKLKKITDKNKEAKKITRKLRPILRVWKGTRDRNRPEKAQRHRDRIEEILKENPEIPQVESQLKSFGFKMGEREIVESLGQECLDFASTVADRLGETKERIVIDIAKLTKKQGQKYILDKVDEALQVEQNGGMMVLDNSRQRTLGGIFLWLIFAERKGLSSYYESCFSCEAYRLTRNNIVLECHNCGDAEYEIETPQTYIRRT